MPTVTNIRATAQTTSDQCDLLTIPPTTTTTPLRIPRRRPRVLLHILQTLMGTGTRRSPMQRQRVNPDYPRQETPIDRCVQLDPYLYIRSLSG